ncbi:hypothetical protein AQJ91_47205 [Streptomyces dysideae]|uniref:Uncharacterized protein n=1 Tax=Streptomyces dysideae TaxID=909626 RepID=A0A101UPE3_9ACTN|nr:hypothetical protein AQJ91_47205 [Streptomyces dysideae]
MEVRGEPGGEQRGADRDRGSPVAGEGDSDAGDALGVLLAVDGVTALADALEVARRASMVRWERGVNASSFRTLARRRSISSRGREASMALPSEVTTAAIRRPMSLASLTCWLPSCRARYTTSRSSRVASSRVSCEATGSAAVAVRNSLTMSVPARKPCPSSSTL